MNLYQPTITGSLEVSGSVGISGSLTINGGTLSGTASLATTASYSVTATSASYAVNASSALSASNASAAATASYVLNAVSASFANNASAAANSTLFNNTASAVFATTGSNNFTGTAYHSNTNDAIGFSNTTASIYTDGGLQVTKNAYFSSSMFIKGNLTVFGTQSVSFITSSQLNISTNIITVNTSTPSVRFGGLAVQDSGSTGLTGSILWDSQDNQWIYTNPSGSEYDSAMFLVGPRNSGTLGNEVGITTNALAKGNGAHHMTSSAIFEVSGSVGIGTSIPAGILEVVGSGSVISRFNSTATNGGVISFQRSGTAILDIGTGLGLLGVGTNNDTAIYSTSTMYLGANGTQFVTLKSGNVGIGTTNPTTKLTIDNSANANTNHIDFVGYSSTPKGHIGQFSHALYLTSNYYYAGGQNNDNSSFGQAAITLAAGTTTTSTISFALSDAGATSPSTKMMILSNGNVGIGVTNPVSALDVNGRISLGGALFTNVAQTETGAGTLASGYNFNLNNGSPVHQATGQMAGVWYNAGVIQWYTNSSQTSNTSAVERMRITSDGRVGIGTTNPVLNLDVVQNTTDIVRIRARNTNASGSAWIILNPEGAGAGSVGDAAIFYDVNNTAWVAGIDKSDSSKYKVSNDPNGDFRTGNYFTIQTNGRIGIQNTSPQGLLEVGVVSTNSTYGGHFFSTFTIPVNTWTTVFTAPNNTWAAITEFTWTSAADFNRSGAAYMRWAYNSGTATLGVVYTLFNNDQNAPATFRNNGGQIQVNITGGAANYYVQVRIQGSQAA